MRDDSAHSGAEQRFPAMNVAAAACLPLLRTVHLNCMTARAGLPAATPLLKLSCTPPAESPARGDERKRGRALSRDRIVVGIEPSRHAQT